MPRQTKQSRRSFLIRASAAGAANTVGGVFLPSLSRSADRPILTHGVQSGDVSVSSGVVWARADRPSRMHVEIAKNESFSDIIHKVWVDALPETDLTAKVAIDNLPAGQDIF